MSDLQREARAFAKEWCAKNGKNSRHVRIAFAVDFAAPREQEIERLRTELAKTKLPIWMLREEHEQEVERLRARVAELEAALVGASKLSPLPETKA